MLDPDLVAQFIRETARDVILPRFRALKPGETSEKSPGDMVTIADIEAERQLAKCLSEVMPEAAVLGEESVAANPALLDLLGGEKPVWVIDPIDGTNNFVRGDPRFSVIVALVERTQPTAGFLYDPLGDRMVWALAGQGAWSAGRRLAIDVAPGKTLTGAGYGKTADGARVATAIQSAGMGLRNFGSGGLEYLALALGELDFSLHSRSLPWDHAAGMLIAQEAGGVARFLDGTRYDARLRDRKVLAAASDKVWRRVRDLVAAPAEAPPL
jgi:fructose-1,6-bisphosphatase/inositol monophosphatase family enzyme